MKAHIVGAGDGVDWAAAISPQLNAIAIEKGTPCFMPSKGRVMLSLPAGERNSREGLVRKPPETSDRLTELWRGPEAESRDSLRLIKRLDRV